MNFLEIKGNFLNSITKQSIKIPPQLVDNRKQEKTSLLSVLTGISEVEVVLDVAGDVVGPSVLWPAAAGLLVVADENPEQNDHGNLPHEADSRQADPNVGVLPAAEKVARSLAAVPHG